MFSNIAQDDSYLKGRALEARARRENSPEGWLDFASLKAGKGSYAPAAMGFLNAGTLLEAAGNSAAAAGAYQSGFSVCVKGKLKEAALLIVSRLAALAERGSDFSAAVSAYEKLGAFFEAQKAFFLAADAYEHAAEMLFSGGDDISAYRKPAELWLLNAQYWAKSGNSGDEAWSRRRAELYLELVKKGKK